MSATDKFKSCPFCAEQIREEAVKCRFCGEWLENISKPKAAPNQKQEELPEPAQVGTTHETTNPSVDLVDTSSELEPQGMDSLKGWFRRHDHSVDNPNPPEAGAPSTTKTRDEPSTPDCPSPQVVQAAPPNHARQTGGSAFVLDGSGERVDKELVPWPSKGLFLWIPVLGYGLVQLDSQFRWTAGTIGLLMAVSVCAWWYQTSKIKCRRTPRLRAFGYLLFGLASIWLIPMPATILQITMKATNRWFVVGWCFLYPMFLVVLFSAAYHFQFRAGVKPFSPSLAGKVFNPSPLKHLGTFAKRGFLILAFCYLAFLAYRNIHWALESRDAAQRQKLSASGVNPDALKGWEVAKGADQRAVDAGLGFPAATKKRMRETFTLSLMGAVGSVSNVHVELKGPEHDNLVVSSPTMNATLASNLPVLLRTADADFWNRARFLGFSEVVFSGSNYYDSIPAAKFAQWGTGYETFVSNTVAMYDTGFSQGQSPTNGSGELKPSVQKVLRQNFASVFKGAFGAIFKAVDVRLEGEDEDRLIFYIHEMDAATANELLKAVKDNKGRNVGNALRAMAFRELAFRGDNYNISYSKTNFVDWSYNYEDYLSELRKAAERISGVMKSE